jgi:hypothetical protein
MHMAPRSVPKLDVPLDRFAAPDGSAMYQQAKQIVLHASGDYNEKADLFEALARQIHDATHDPTFPMRFGPSWTFKSLPARNGRLIMSGDATKGIWFGPDGIRVGSFGEGSFMVEDGEYVPNPDGPFWDWK